ncbi:MAG: tetratricopeptide repeat protein [Candidatus Sericytochromatia bacterium]
MIQRRLAVLFVLLGWALPAQAQFVSPEYPDPVVQKSAEDPRLEALAYVANCLGWAETESAFAALQGLANAARLISLQEEAAEALQNGQSEAALPLYLQILAHEPETLDISEVSDYYASSYFYLGLAYYNLRLYSFALEAFEQAEKRLITPPPNLYFSLGMVHYYSQALELAQDYLNRVIADPLSSTELKQAAEEQLLLTLRDQSGAYQEGLKAYQDGRFAEAIVQLEEALRFMPNSGELHYYLGASQVQVQNFEAARKHFQAVLKLEPDSEIATQAQLTLEVIDKIGQNLPQKPFFGSVLLGGILDTNVNFGGPTDNTTQLPAGALATGNLIDEALLLNLSLGYQWLPEWGLRYNLFLQQFLGLNHQAGANLTSTDFNLQLHTLSLLNRFALSDSLDLSLTSQADAQWLGGKPLSWGGVARPVLTWYASERLVSRLSFSLAGEVFSEFHERDNLNHQLGLEQYIYLWGSQTWLRFGYDWLQVYARDNLLSRELQSQNNLFEVDYRFANSRVAHQVGLGLGFPVGPLLFEVGSRMDFIDYTQPDLVSQYIIGINPLTGLPLPREQYGTPVEKFRADTRLLFYLQMEWPLAKDLKLQGRYTRTTLVSNITPDDYSVSRSYLKDVFNFSLRYDF